MIELREARTGDAAALAALGRQSFDDAFADLYRPEDLAAFHAATYTPGVVAAEIANPDRVYRLAEQDGRLIGYCKLGLDRSLEWDAGDVPTIELKQLYLLGAATGTGIGSRLVEWAVDEARARGFGAMILSVYSGNLGGQRFYRRHGFEKWGDTHFMVGRQRDDEFIFGRML